MNSFKLKRVLAAATGSVILFVGSAIASEGHESSLSYRLDIPAQSLDAALQSLALASNHKLLYPSNAVAEKQSPALKGEFTAEQAVQRLLAGTNLTYEINGSSVVLIRDKSEKPMAQMREPEGQRADASQGQGTRLVQVEGSSADSGASASGQASVNEQNDQSAGKSAQGEKVEEIIVSAQRRGDESLQKTPISVTVLDGQELDSSTFSDVTDALQNVPGLISTPQFSNAGYSYSLRGVTGDTLAAGSGPIAYYVDGVPYGFVRNAFYPVGPSVYDMERIEVLNGPQGTLYGASALSGVIRVLTHDADVEAFDLKARTSLSQTEGGGTNYSGDGAVNVPIVQGRLGARLTAGYRSDGGWIDTPLGEDVNDMESKYGRLKIRALLTETLSMGASLWRSETTSGAPPLV